MSGVFIEKISRAAAEQYIQYGELAPLPMQLPPELWSQRACYVSIFENPGRHLRAMYGSPLPTKSSLADEIRMNTIAAIRGRAPGLFRKSELRYLTYSIAVLGPLEKITSKYHLDPIHYGLYVKTDRSNSAILLPQRTGIETADEQIATAMREGGINMQEEAVSMYRFPVTFYE